MTLVPLDLTNGRSVGRARRRDRRQGRHRRQQRRGPPRLRHRRAPRHRRRQGRDGHQLLRPAAPGAGVRPGAEGPLGRRRRRTPRRWVNLLSVYALSNYPPHGTFSASKAAAYSLAQCLRAEMRPTGIRVINVFPGRSTTSGTRTCRRPKVAPAALASAIVKALKEGIEDVYPGDVAQEWLERWRENPKVLERRAGGGRLKRPGSGLGEKVRERGPVRRRRCGSR